MRRGRRYPAGAHDCGGLRFAPTPLLLAGRSQNSLRALGAPFAQTAATSQFTKRASAPAPRPSIAAATEIAPAGYRLPRATWWACERRAPILPNGPLNLHCIVPPRGCTIRRLIFIRGPSVTSAGRASPRFTSMRWSAVRAATRNAGCRPRDGGREPGAHRCCSNFAGPAQRSCPFFVTTCCTDSTSTLRFRQWVFLRGHNATHSVSSNRMGTRPMPFLVSPIAFETSWRFERLPSRQASSLVSRSLRLRWHRRERQFGLART